MKLTKDKKKALQTLKNIIDFYLDENKKGAFFIKHNEYSSIKKHLNIDLKEIMYFKKEVDFFVCGCDDKYLKIFFGCSENHECNRILKNYYFPMQIKKLKPKEKIKKVY